MAVPYFAAQFVRYAGAGAIGTAVHFAVLIALVQFAAIDAVVASTAGALAGALVNYVLNYRFTFASRRAHRLALPRFGVVSVAGIALNAAVIVVVLPYVQPYYVIAQMSATAVVLCAGFLVNRTWTF
jgi:putative flippase GtrA